MTKKFVKEYGFPDDRIKFIRNEKQMFATYNIYNAANNECGRREILVLLDGDD